jgi:hypothetical protein
VRQQQRRTSASANDACGRVIFGGMAAEPPRPKSAQRWMSRDKRPHVHQSLQAIWDNAILHPPKPPVFTKARIPKTTERFMCYPIYRHGLGIRQMRLAETRYVSCIFANDQPVHTAVYYDIFSRALRPMSARISIATTPQKVQTRMRAHAGKQNDSAIAIQNNAATDTIGSTAWPSSLWMNLASAVSSE